ncbi:MAG: hypothetical protein EBR82_63400, partial [Caulobacteraceae bacterium]|nr:hypothetical protein [Caulobacteraceae bacterium]
MVKTIQAQTVISNASNVVPLNGGAAGTAILTNTIGKWATTAQEVVKDSFWLTREAYETTDTNGKSTGLNWTFIRNTYFEFDDLSGRLDKLPIGDTIQARSALLGWQVDMIRQHSYHAVQAMKKGQVIADWQQVNAAMKANGLGGLDDAMQAAFEGRFLGDA